MEKWSPANFIGRWRTPMLIVHGQHDYRVDVDDFLVGEIDEFIDAFLLRRIQETARAGGAGAATGKES